MRIGLFTDAFWPDINGVVSSVDTLRHALQALGHTVFIITNHSGSKIVQEQDILRLPGLELKRFYGYKMTSPFQFRAEEYIRSMDLDVIHIHTEAGVGLFGRQMAKTLHLPVVYTYHTLYEDYTHYINPMDLVSVEKLGKRAIRSLSKIFANGMQAVIAPSNKTKEILLDYGVLIPIYVVPTGLELSLFDPSKMDQNKLIQIREDLGLTDADHAVVFVGRIAKEKMLEYPIEALSMSDDLHLHFVIVGAGPDQGYYEELAKKYGCQDRVHFTGRVDKEDIGYYYAAFDCFVSASTTETQGLTYIEAMASGISVFGRRDPVLKELIEEGETGYYFDTAEELLKKWKTFFSLSKEKRQAFGARCQEKVVVYNTEIFAHKVLAVYEQAIDDYSQSFEVEKIKVLDDFVQLTLRRDSDDEPKKIVIPLDDFFDLKIMVHTKLDAYIVENYISLQDFYGAYKIVKKRVLAKDYTSHEVQAYCQKVLDLSSEDALAMVMLLEEKNLINDRQYAIDKASAWQSYGYGRGQIEMKLRKAGVPLEWIDEACEKLEESVDMDNAIKMAKRFASSVKSQSNRLAKQTIINKLVTKGFSLDVAKRAFMQVDLNEDESEALDITVKKARRLYASFEGDKRREKIRMYCLRKGFDIGSIDAYLEGLEKNDQ